MQRALLFRFATTDSLVSFTIPPTHETKFREFSLPHRPWLLDIPLGEQFYSDVRDAGCSPLSVLHTYDLRVKDTHYVVSHTRIHTHTHQISMTLFYYETKKLGCCERPTLRG